MALAEIDSVNAPAAARESAWALLAERLDPGLLEEISTTMPLAQVPDVAVQVLAGHVRGRTVVDVNS